MTGLRAADWAAALRLRQWTKNTVVLAAFVFALGDPAQHVGWASAWRALAAAGVFCLLSSGVYLVNDVRDRARDRLHPVKCRRPVADGRLAAGTALAAAAALWTAAFAAALLLSARFAAVAVGYVALQAAYTLGLKQLPLLDVLAIAAGFVLRALAGAVALAVRISPWLLVCAMLLALFLALCKRRHEKLSSTGADGATRPVLARYSEKTLDRLIAAAVAATLACYSVYALSPATVRKFGTHALGFTIPFVAFGLFRYLDLVYRRELGDRPEQVLLTDVPLLLDLALYAAAVLLVFGLS